MARPEVTLTGYDSREYRMLPLTAEAAEAHADKLLEVHNLIPHVTWTSADLLSNTHSSGAPYKNKWELSTVVFSADDVVSFLIAWERGVSETHPFEAIYLHRMAVRPDHRRNGLARQILSTTLEDYARNLPTIDTYTLQTNDDASNQHTIDFYESLGFKRIMPVPYPDKLDVLMKLSRDAVIASAPGLLDDMSEQNPA